jgi:hypothetical protein
MIVGMLVMQAPRHALTALLFREPVNHMRIKMNRRPLGIAAEETKGIVDRSLAQRRLPWRKTVMALIAVALPAAGMFVSVGPAIADATSATQNGSKPMTPEVKFVDDYSTWMMGGSYGSDLSKLKAGLAKYITNETVLNEAASLPWGGKMVGYDGWAHLTQASAPALAVVAPLLEMSKSHYFQSGHVVFREFTITVKPSKAAPDPFVMGIIEQFTLSRGRIKQVDVYYEDTAAFLQRMAAIGVLPAKK